MNPTDFDVLIVGAGIAGATLACALGDTDYRVGVLDLATMPDWPTGSNQPGSRDYDHRVSAINVGSARVLDAVGAWSTITAHRHQPFHAMRVWDEAGKGVTHFDATDLGEPCFGTITENRLIARALLERAQQLDNVSLLFESALTQIESDNDRVCVTLDQNRTLCTRLLVGADGGRSHARTLTGINMPFKNYQQRTLVGTVQTQLDHQDTAWQRFLPTGPCAYLPLAAHLCSLAWHADTALADELLALDETAFNTRLAQATEHCLGEPTMLGKPGAFPLFRGHADRYVDNRVALIGDAAHVLHPLAGLGANLGIMDAACLAESLLDYGRDDPGRSRPLRHYERWRRPENAAVVAATDAFYEVFGQRNRSAVSLRNLGLRLADKAGPVKEQVMRLAAGVTGDLPRSALAI